MLAILFLLGLGLAAGALVSSRPAGSWASSASTEERAELDRARAAQLAGPERSAPDVRESWGTIVANIASGRAAPQAVEALAETFERGGYHALAQGLRARLEQRGPVGMVCGEPLPVAAMLNRRTIEAWARCPERTSAEIEAAALEYDRLFQTARTDREALAYAQARDAMHAAFMAGHPEASAPR